MTRQPPYDYEENRGTVAMYFEMLDNTQRGYKFIKAELIRIAQDPESTSSQLFAGTLANRKRGSIEFKLMNCSAAHADIDPNAETMHSHGYRALPNYQRSLKTAMRNELTRRRAAEQIAEATA